MVKRVLKNRLKLFTDALLSQSERGFTLIEALIAITLMLLMMLALYQSAAIIMARNIENTMQDTCIKVANEKIEDLRKTSFSSLTSGTFTDTVNRQVRNFIRTFRRETILVQRSSTLYTVTVTVFWKLHEGDEEHSCSMSTAIADHG